MAATVERQEPDGTAQTFEFGPGDAVRSGGSRWQSINYNRKAGVSSRLI
jgi:hypothetical protein